MPGTRRIRGWILWLTIVLIAAAGGVAFLYQRENGKAEEKYRTSVVGRGDITMCVTATGTISAVTTVQVGSQVSGIISHLYADFNSPVKRGQLLAELDPTPFQAAVEQRRADLLQIEVQLRNAEVTFHRQERLLADGLAAQADYDAAKAAYDAAAAQVEQQKAALSQAETNLAYTKIFSPIDGVVVARHVDVGQTVAASFQAPTLFTIAEDLTRMQVQADVDQSDIGRVHMGQTARFTVDAYPDEQFQGRISQIRLNATVNQNVITYPVIIEVSNPDLKLRPQMAANVSLEVAQVKDVLRVPSAALRFRPPETVGQDKGKVAASLPEATGKPAAGAASALATPGTATAAPAATAQAATTPDTSAQAAPSTGPASSTSPGSANANGLASPAENRGRHGSSGQRSAWPAPAGASPAAPETGRRPGAGSAGASSRGLQTVYTLAATEELKPVAIHVGISDGTFVQVLEGEIKPGDKVVTGLATAKAAESSSRFPGGRMF